MAETFEHLSMTLPFSIIPSLLDLNGKGAILSEG